MKKKITNLPQNPGCYLFLDSSKKIIYVGKAKNLKKRVASYFNKNNLDSKSLALVSQIKDVDFIITNTEVEALILENNLIKKNQPKYNIDLKDSKSYAYIRLTDEEFPRLIVCRNKKELWRHFGPFVNARERDYVLNLLVRTFKIRTCKRLPKKICLRYDLGLCSAPCVKIISKKNYTESINEAVLILKGKTSELKKSLKNAMDKSSKIQDFETALELRNKIIALNHLRAKQVMERSKKYDENVINYLVKDSKVYLMVFKVYKGLLDEKEEFVFEYNLGENILSEFLVQYYSENKIPKEIILPEQVDSSIADYLRKIRGKKVVVNVAQKGEKKNLLDLVKKNVEAHFFGEFEKLEELQKKLNLENLPKVIECFDVSHLSGTETVASMVQFRNGKPDKTNYRKFKIKGDFGIDDFACMKEVVYRRYYKLVKEKSNLPDLIVIDGGLGQLHYAMKSLEELGIKIPIIGLAKREEEIYLGEEILHLNKKNKGLLLLIAIRDEAHRFAINFQRLRRKKSLFGKV